MKRRLLLAVTLIVTLSACTFSAPHTPTPASSDPPPSKPTSDLLKQIEKREQKWQKREITSYRIEVTETRSTWHMQTHAIVVRDGQVVESSASCNPAPAELGKCTVEPFDAQDYLVPALFALARKEAQGNPEQIKLTFDRRYGFPSWIVDSGTPGIVDGSGTWKVESFEVLD